MNLLFLHDRFGAMAGAEANAFSTAAELKQRGHRVAILHGPPTGKGEAEWREVFSPRFPYLPHRPDEMLRKAIKEFQPDVIYVHKLADIKMLEALASCDVPVARMVHDHELYCMRSYKYSFFTRQICTRPLSPYCIFPCGAAIVRNRQGLFPVQWVSYFAKKKELKLNKQFDRLVVATHYMQTELVRNGFEPNKIEIHPPVPNFHVATQMSNFGPRNLLLYVGQIIRGKGVDVLLEALARLTVPYECLIIGDGSHRPYCEELSRTLGLEHRVCFKGYLPHGELTKYYRECSVLLMSSVWPEPFGAVGLEGMRHGLPVVAFDAGGISEWLIDDLNGYLVPWMNRAQYAQKVQYLLENKDVARRLGLNGSLLLQKEYDFTRYVSNLEKMFQKLAGERTLQAA